MPCAVTRAAEGFDRRAFTVDEVLRMQELGIFAEDERFELIEGEIVPKQAKFVPHGRIESILSRAIFAVLPTGLELFFDTSLQISRQTFVNPDLCLCRLGRPGPLIDPADVLLAIEVSDSTLGYDRGLKARHYARAGVPELWVVDVATRRTFVHRAPTRDGWSVVEPIEAGESITTAALPGLKLVLPKV